MVLYVKALQDYLGMCGQHPNPLFLFQDGTSLTHSCLVEAVRSALHGMNVQAFSGHSFRIGTATTAVAWGLPGSLI